MNKDILQGHWNEVKGKIQQQWGKLTNNDIQKMKGTTNELLGALQEKYGVQREEAEKQIKNFINRQGWQ